MNIFNNYNFILVSKSPRRQQLLEGMGIKFKIKTKEINEKYPKEYKREKIPIYLCELKANAFADEIKNKKTILISADTLVFMDNKVLDKPKSYTDAFNTLSKLSGNMHEVITGVCLKSKNKMVSFYDVSKVYFKKLTKEEIEFYINTYKPYDKAGAYGAQEWIGYIGISKIEGSYFNVMGLPTHKLYEELVKFCK
ncbi:MAG: Maf family nucleotide pyrophosphatase [Bacteroidales bacterium]|nr:Maf family nucleotide pyrophosphatase [Bacteroidales bacterium]